MYSLLAPGGKLVGVLFDRTFDIDGPPFGGCKSEYARYFDTKFDLEIFEQCNNSHPPRAGTELFVKLIKRER